MQRDKSATSGFLAIARAGVAATARDDGAPGGTRTHGLQVRNLTLYPLSYGRTRRCVLGIS